MQAQAGQIIFAYFQYFASCGYALLPDNSFPSFVMLILMYNIALLSGTSSVCCMHYEIQTASDKHCRCLGMQLSLHYTVSLTTLFSTCQELSSWTFQVDSPGTVLIITLLDILALDILGLDILGLDILGLDILGIGSGCRIYGRMTHVEFSVAWFV